MLGAPVKRDGAKVVGAYDGLVMMVFKRFLINFFLSGKTELGNKTQ